MSVTKQPDLGDIQFIIFLPEMFFCYKELKLTRQENTKLNFSKYKIQMFWMINSSYHLSHKTI